MKKILILVLLVTLFIAPVHAQESSQAYTPEDLLQMWEQLIPMMREAECYPYVELRQGDKGYEVIFLQTRLTELFYYGKTIDPQFGSGTFAAIKMFEKAHGLPVNGIASVADQKLLFSSKAMTNPGTPAGIDAGQTKKPKDDGSNTLPGWVDQLATASPRPLYDMIVVPTPTPTPIPVPTKFFIPDFQTTLIPLTTKVPPIITLHP